jgi:hypothetical protein
MPNLVPYIWSVIAVSAAAAILIAMAFYAWRRNQRSEQLRLLFGSEYDRAVHLYGDRHRAEQALDSRRKRLADFGVHELGEAERQRFLANWRMIQSGSTTDPATVIVRADVLLADVMRAEGYPVDDPGERKVDLALVHPSIAEDYRNASDILERQRLGLATPDECRHAVDNFSRVFDSILGTDQLRDHLKKVS